MQPILHPRRTRAVHVEACWWPSKSSRRGLLVGRTVATWPNGHGPWRARLSRRVPLRRCSRITSSSLLSGAWWSKYACAHSPQLSVSRSVSQQRRQFARMGTTTIWELKRDLRRRSRQQHPACWSLGHHPRRREISAHERGEVAGVERDFPRQAGTSSPDPRAATNHWNKRCPPQALLLLTLRRRLGRRPCDAIAAAHVPLSTRCPVFYPLPLKFQVGIASVRWIMDIQQQPMRKRWERSGDRTYVQPWLATCQLLVFSM